MKKYLDAFALCFFVPGRKISGRSLFDVPELKMNFVIRR